MSSNRHLILNHVDSPLKVLLWTRGEIFLYVLPAFIGLLCNKFMLGMVVSGLNIYLNRKYKKRFGKGQLQAVMYWFFPSFRFKKVPPSHIREFLG